MASVKVVSSGRKRRIIDISQKAHHVDAAIVAKAFDAMPAGSSTGLDLFALREAMRRMLKSTGGRPALEGSASQAKIPRIAEDWRKLEKLAAATGDLEHKPSVGQMAAMVLHLGLQRISEDEVRAAIRKELA
jgi:hypothetical protein